MRHVGGVEVRGLRRGSWEMIEDVSVGVYFYHYSTDESQWEPPAAFLHDVRRCRGLQRLVVGLT